MNPCHGFGSLLDVGSAPLLADGSWAATDAWIGSAWFVSVAVVLINVTTTSWLL